MSRSWGLAVVDLDFVRSRVVPYVFRPDDAANSALLDGLDIATTERRLRVMNALLERLPAEVTGDDYADPRKRAWQDAVAFGSELGRPFLLFERNNVGALIDRYLASDTNTCLEVLNAAFAAAFPDWHRDAGHPQSWPPSPWQSSPSYPPNVTSGLDLLHEMWSAHRRGETEFVLPMNRNTDDGEEPRRDVIAEYLDHHTPSLLLGYTIAHTPTIWGGGGWVTPVGMLDHLQLPTTHFRRARDVFASWLPAGVFQPEAAAHYNKGRLIDDTACVLGGVVLATDVAAVRQQFIEVGRRLADPQAGAAAAARHLGIRAGLRAMVDALFGKPAQSTVTSDEATAWAEGFAAESAYTLAMFDEAFSYAEARGLAVVETSSTSVEWPVGIAD